MKARTKGWEVWTRAGESGDEAYFVESFHDRGEALRRIAKLQASQRRQGMRPYRYELRRRKSPTRRHFEKRKAGRSRDVRMLVGRDQNLFLVGRDKRKKASRKARSRRDVRMLVGRRDASKTYETTIEGLPVRIAYHPKMRVYDRGTFKGIGGWSASLLSRDRKNSLPGPSASTAEGAERAMRAMLRRSRASN